MTIWSTSEASIYPSFNLPFANYSPSASIRDGGFTVVTLSEVRETEHTQKLTPCEDAALGGTTGDDRPPVFSEASGVLELTGLK